MIQIIGIMIGTYIFTRMAELIHNKEAGAIVKFFAVVTLLVSIFGTIALLFTGTPAGLR